MAWRRAPSVDGCRRIGTHRVARGAGTRGSANNPGGSGDPERIRLQTSGAAKGPKYTQQLDEQDEQVGIF